jgi:ribonuclease D
MSEPVVPIQDAVEQEKNRNFAELRKIAESERNARLQLEKEVAQLRNSMAPKAQDDDDDDEPYVDRKKLKMAMEQTKQQTTQEVQLAVRQALDQERRNNYLDQNSDFERVMNSDLVQKFADTNPRLAKAILSMPESFERQQLVYENIKSLRLDAPPQKEVSIQEKVDQNKRSPYYQPSGVGAAPYGGIGGKEYSEADMKNGFEHMKALQRRLKI